MNKITIYLYLADLFQSISVLLGLLGFAGAIASAFYLLHLSEHRYPGSYRDSDEMQEAWKKDHEKTIWRRGKQAALLVFSMWIIASIIPSKQTAYAMIASESMTSTAAGNKAMKAIDAWLDAQINPKE